MDAIQSLSLIGYNFLSQNEQILKNVLSDTFMTLILTTTCDYALLVAIAEGAGFPSNSDHDIFLHSRLALHLPDTVGDLIPPSTIIAAKPTKLTPTPQWRTTLIYFLSARLFNRLKRRRAEVTLQVMTMTERGAMHELGTVVLRVDHAKAIKATQRRYQQPQQHEQPIPTPPPLNVLKDYVIDKGDWKPVIQDGNASTTDGTQIKVGLFVVEMPLHAGERHRETIQPSGRHHHHHQQQHHQHHQHQQQHQKHQQHEHQQQLFSRQSEDDNNSLDDMDLEMHSVDIIGGMMTTNLSSFITTYDSNDNDMEQQPIPTTQSSSATTASSSSLSSRTNINKKENGLWKSISSIEVCFRIIQHNNGPFPYLQIGSGSQQYTFVLRLVEATAVMSLIPPPLTITKSKNNPNGNITPRKWMQYTFSDWQVKHDVMTKGNAWLVTDQPMCLSLQGHLHDLQQWLSQQGPIEVCLVLAAADKLGKGELTIGKSMVRLNGWCPVGKIEQASFPIHDRSNRLHVDPPFQFARVVVQLGLVKGWENNLDGQQMGFGLVNSNDNNNSNNISSSSSNSITSISSDSMYSSKKHPFIYQQNLIK